MFAMCQGISELQEHYISVYYEEREPGNYIATRQRQIFVASFMCALKKRAVAPLSSVFALLHTPIYYCIYINGYK